MRRVIHTAGQHGESGGRGSRQVRDGHRLHRHALLVRALERDMVERDAARGHRASCFWHSRDSWLAAKVSRQPIKKGKLSPDE